MAKRLVYGDEPYLVRQYKKEVAKGIELPEMNLMASDAFGEEELRFLQQPPLCSERKVLLLEMPQLKINPELSAYWKNPTETSDVVVVADRIDKRTTDFKSFRSEEIQLCNKLGKAVLEKTILQYVKKNGAKIKQSAYQTLLERLNYHDNEDVNLFTVFHVLNRLCPLREITRELVVSAIRDNAKENAFRLMGLVTQRRTGELFREADLIIHSKGGNSISVLSLLLRSFRLAFKSRACGCSLAEMGVSGRTPLPSMSLEQANRGMNAIQKYINGIKCGRYRSDLALKLCLGELCEGMGTAN